MQLNQAGILVMKKGRVCFFFQLPFVSDCFTQEQALLGSHLLTVRGVSPLKGFPLEAV